MMETCAGSLGSAFIVWGGLGDGGGRWGRAATLEGSVTLSCWILHLAIGSDFCWEPATWRAPLTRANRAFYHPLESSRVLQRISFSQTAPQTERGSLQTHRDSPGSRRRVCPSVPCPQPPGARHTGRPVDRALSSGPAGRGASAVARFPEPQAAAEPGTGLAARTVRQAVASANAAVLGRQEGWRVLAEWA